MIIVRKLKTEAGFDVKCMKNLSSLVETKKKSSIYIWMKKKKIKLHFTVYIGSY